MLRAPMIYYILGITTVVLVCWIIRRENEYRLLRKKYHNQEKDLDKLAQLISKLRLEAEKYQDELMQSRIERNKYGYYTT